MSPEQAVYCIKAFAEGNEDHISDENWHEIQTLVQEVDFRQVEKQQFSNFERWLYKDAFPVDTD